MINVRIITPTEIAFEGAVKEIRAPGYHGELGVLDGHERFLSVSTPGRFTIFGDDERTWVVGAGFLEVGADSVTLLTDLCEPVGAVGVEQAMADLKAAEENLVTLQAGSVLWTEAERIAAISRARIG